VVRPSAACCLALMLAISSSARADCGDTDASPEEDCDEDGWTKGQGDCDDDDDAANPGKTEEVCGDRADNDCNGFFDDGCDDATTRGGLIGGSSCGTSEGAALLFLAPLALLRRRR
jgi:hypothetical protein